MSSPRFNRCSAALMVLIVISGSAVGHHGSGQAAAAEPATQPAASGASVNSSSADIEIGKPVKYPQLFTPMVEEGLLKDGHHGEPLIVQEFLYNPATHELSMAAKN